MESNTPGLVSELHDCWLWDLAQGAELLESLGPLISKMGISSGTSGFLWKSNSIAHFKNSTMFGAWYSRHVSC